MILAVNFKEHFNLRETLSYFRDITQILEEVEKSNLKIIFFPSNPYLSICKNLITKKGYRNVFLGAQNVSVFTKGACTGEVSAIQLKDYVSYCLVNHSERVRYFSEDSKMAKAKIENLLEQDIIPITCVSESNEVSFFADFLDKIIIAFEPTEFIGGKNFCGIPTIQKFYFESKLSSKFVYGGSVDNISAKLLVEYKDLEGLLVSSYCLKSSNFVNLVNMILQK
ncbi:triosephosphate isomerase [Patescibacteria group bacterium]|nr:triosephosphate isomerase [Patescibacteria group bacterium]